MSDHVKHSSPGSSRAVLTLLLILSVYGALTLPTLGRQGVNWDEQTDLDITHVYVSSNSGLVHGSRDDAVNTRLPMYTTGLLLRVFDVDPLMLARLLSTFLAALTIIGVFVFCSLELDRTRGLVAATLLATSPYFLFFGKLALTEGDVWITAAVTWLLVAAAWYRSRPNIGRAAILGLSLGIALSAKISGLALVPAVGLAILLEARKTGPDGEVGTSLTPSGRVFLFLVLAGFLMWTGLNELVSLAVISQLPIAVATAGVHPLVRWAMGIVLSGVLASWVLRHRSDRIGPLWTVLASFLAAAFTFFLVPPVHVTNPWIIAALGNQFLGGGSGFDLSFAAEAALFHLEVIAIKSSPVIGVGLWVGLVLTVARSRNRPGLVFALLGFAFYFVFLLLLPWAQTRYMMPLLPILVIFAADGLVDLNRKRPVITRGVVALAAVLLVADIVSCYPDLNLVGHPWVGERYLGRRATLGYRGIVHTGSDGIEQSLRWLAEHAGPDEQVVTVYGEIHITRAVLADVPLRMASMLHEPIDLSEADWVVTSINYDLQPRIDKNTSGESIYAYPHYDRTVLEQEFGKVFSVERAYGIEVAAVWRRQKGRP